MNNEIFNRWQYESESDSLDFKRDQYKFIGASSDEKSELLKDILAMANSWRRADGYIILGIKENPEKPNILYGITDHLDDATIQQFVKNKVNRVCQFEYKTYTKDNLTYGIFKIPIQKRPIFLKQNYGKLKANTVYVRRGSSTDEAKPDEISQMGIYQSEQIHKADIEFGFLDKPKGQMVGTKIEFETTYINILDKIPDYSESSGSLYSIQNTVDRNYNRLFYKYVMFKISFCGIGFAIRNKGNNEAVNLRIEIEFPSNNIEILTDGQEETKPGKELFANISIKGTEFKKSSFSVDRKEDRYLIYNKIDRLHAKRTMEVDGTIYLQVQESKTIKGKARIFFDGQSEPHEQEIELKIDCKSVNLGWNEFRQQLRQI